MIPRQRLDIGLFDILLGIGYCFWPGSRTRTQQGLGNLWSSSSDTVVCLAERSGFDLILDALDLPRGSEILISAMNIRSMFEVIERHGLVAVPIDLDMATLAMKREELDRAVNKNTKAILFAQLFGSRLPMDEVIEFAREHNLFVFEDCAQSFAGDKYTGHVESDVTMVSFGPIKTCSTIMGGILRFKDHDLAKEVARRQEDLPLHSRWNYLFWLLHFAKLKTLSARSLFTVVMWIAHRLGVQDKKLNDAVRVFGGADEVKKFRRKPSYPMLALLEHRLKNFDAASIEQRNAAARTIIDRLPLFLRRPGEDAPVHNHWIFPVEVSDPVGLMKHLRTLGFDSINGYGSFIIPEPPLGFEDFLALEARNMMENVLYLPVHTGVSESELIRLAEAISDFEHASRYTAEHPVSAPNTQPTRDGHDTGSVAERSN
ncbi:MAG: DegT/DnrJ/EryC1/StrS family aminotransferase [Planctomycetaceae bacterium]|nr:DegT/DnrJ/EryC1/StrS family aminotransferase [Planctomycetales bacterium]MCB9921690.1 DegT/DnrJ/EryC1/StrS family aminotransferase [Planctomycetaceae bacterium]